MTAENDYWSKFDPYQWFKVMEGVADLHKYKAHKCNNNYLPPITKSKVEIGDISLLTEFSLNEEVLSQESSTRLSDRVGNEKIGRWYGQKLIHGDRNFSWILNKNIELIVLSNVRPDIRTKCPNIEVGIPKQIQGSYENTPLLEYKEIIENSSQESTA